MANAPHLSTAARLNTAARALRPDRHQPNSHPARRSSRRVVHGGGESLRLVDQGVPRIYRPRPVSPGAPFIAPIPVDNESARLPLGRTPALGEHPRPFLSILSKRRDLNGRHGILRSGNRHATMSKASLTWIPTWKYPRSFRTLKAWG